MIKIRNYRFEGKRGLFFLVFAIFATIIAVGLAISFLPFVIGAGLGYLAYKKVSNLRARNITLAAVTIFSLLFGIPWASAFWSADTKPSQQVSTATVTISPTQEPAATSEQERPEKQASSTPEAAEASPIPSNEPTPSPDVAGAFTEASKSPVTVTPASIPVKATESTPIPTPLPATPKPAPAKAAISTPTPKPAPPKASCSSDLYNCSQFSSCAEVMAVFNACPGDLHRLDRNKDGVPCEDLCA